MATVKKSDLQQSKYNYTWSRDQGDGEYTGIRDRERIDKDEGYEVTYFIQAFLNRFSLADTSANIHKVEDKLQKSEYSNIVMREELIKKLKEAFSL